MNTTQAMIIQYKEAKEKADDNLTEVLCSAYKDATGQYPSERLRDKLFEVIRYERV